MKYRYFLVVVPVVLLGVSSVWAQETADSPVSTVDDGTTDVPTPDHTTDATVDVERTTETTVAATAPSANENLPADFAFENTLEACTDNVDNDQDGFVDCADQDCHIFAVCVTDTDANGKENTIAVAPSAKHQRTENCHRSPWRHSRYCQHKMYMRPEPPNKPMGFFAHVGAGAALPHYKWKEVSVDSQYGDGVIFDPDVGISTWLKLGAAPLRWMGAGVFFANRETVATNREDLLSLRDDSRNYKYDGVKISGNIGGFVRFQYPQGRWVPYLDMSFSYGFARYRWKIYSGSTYWSDINDEWTDDETAPAFEKKYKQGDYFSLALQPGVDVYVARRLIAVGVAANLPIFASSNVGMENIGILLTATFTPTWREPKQLKPEYRQP